MIVLGLLAINWSSELIWQQFESQQDPQIERVTELALIVAHTANQQEIANLALILDFDIITLEADDVMWLDWQRKLLDNQGVVISFDQNDHIVGYVYSMLGGKLLKLGPFDPEIQHSATKNIILFLSYVLLAGVIALWIRPLWRDLRQLQQASKQFGQGLSTPDFIIREGAFIAPVLKTFNGMTQKIALLIEEQKQLVNAVSHDIRTPLARLKFSFAMLEPQQVNQLDNMKQDVAELEMLVDEMLNYGRLESDGLKLSISDVSINELLTNLVEKLARATDKAVNLKIDQVIQWRCDGHFIERVTQNLVTNAIRYANSNIAITAVIHEDKLYLSVEDDGEGIAAADFDKVFKAFTRLDQSRNKEQGGFGLGLAIVKKIVDWHRGQCQVSCSELGGAKFLVILPANL